MTSELFNKSILVVAHPDDEILWFSSILDKVDDILVCFHEYPLDSNLTDGRSRVLEQYPMKNLSSLNVREPMSFAMADWQKPTTNQYGLLLVKDKQANERYMKSFHELTTLLDSKLSGYENVFTHNPWGEYGHEDHVQVHAAVKQLQARHHFTQWHQNYCGTNAIALMQRYINGFSSDYHTLDTNTGLALEIAELYKKNQCWTWYDDFVWFNNESFMADNSDAPQQAFGHAFALNLIKTDFTTTGDPGKLANMLKKIRHVIRR